MMSTGKNESVIYLDCNATTPLAPEVADGIRKSLTAHWGNPSSLNCYGIAAKDAVDNAREQVAQMLNCSSEKIIFTSGGTEGNNMIIHSAVQYFKAQNQVQNNGDHAKPHFITTNVEHDSVILPILELQKEGIVDCSIVKVGDNGCINVDHILLEITPQTCLITVMYANNETGVIMPVPELGERISQINDERSQTGLCKILFHTDAAQVIGKMKIDFSNSNVDFMTVVGHKFYGPRIGCICAKEKIFPLLFGGGQERGLRPGTENTPMIVGLGIAAKLVHKNIYTYNENMFYLRNYLVNNLKDVFGDEIVVNCSETERLPNTCNISFTQEGLEGPLVLGFCKKVIASVGASCHGMKCSQILINSGVPMEMAKNAIRFSIGRDTTYDDIKEAVLDLKMAVTLLKATLQRK